MPRIRSIKPEFFTSLNVASLTHRARLTWIGLWTYADDDGRGRDDARLVKAAVWPLDDDVTSIEVDADLDELHMAGRIIRYEVDGRRYFEVTGFGEHQKPNRPTKSHIPPRVRTNDSVNAHGANTEGSSPEGRGGVKEREGADAVSGTCSRHPNGTNEPCIACRDNRQAKSQAAPRSPRPPKKHEIVGMCSKHEGRPAWDCDRCREELRATA